MISGDPALNAKPDRRLVIVASLLMMVWNVISWRFPFFWDTVLSSKIAHWYLETGFSQLTVPENLDAGHPPFFGMYIALAWQVFGRSLAVAHIAMLPFLGLLLWQYLRLAKRWLSDRGCIWAMALLFCEPTFLAQSSMVSSDIALVAFYLLAFNACLDDRRAVVALALPLMAAMSFRGIMMVPLLFATEVLIAWFSGARKPNWLKIWPYLPVALLTATWLWIHLKA